MSAHVKIVPLLDVYQLLVLFAGSLTYSEPRTFSIIIISLSDSVKHFNKLIEFNEPVIIPRKIFYFFNLCDTGFGA